MCCMSNGAVNSYYAYQYKYIYSTEMALRNDYGFAYEYICWDCEYIIRTMMLSEPAIH